MVINNIQIGSCSKGFDVSLTSEEQTKFVVTGCGNGATKETFKGEVIIKYTEKNTNLTKTAYGSITTKIE